MATTQTATANPYAQDAQKAKFRQTVSELYRKRKDPNYVKFALEQVGYDGSLVDQELSRMQAIESGQPVQQKQTFSGIPGENLDQNLLAEGQRTALLYGQRMFQSGKILDKLDDSIGSKGLLGSIKQKGDEMAAGGTITGQFVSDEFKQFDQAKRDFINASLRRESGAVISPEEFENAKKQYFPVPGDSPEVLAQKKANRELQARGFLKSAGVSDSEINFSADGQSAQPQTPQSSQVEQAKQWLQANPNDPRAEKVKAKLLSLEGGVSASPSPEQAQQQGGSFDLGKAADKVANFLGIKKFGEGIGATIFLNTTEGKDLQKKAAEGDKVALEALQAVLDEAPSAKEVIGSAALTALNVASGGVASATTKSGMVAAGAATGYGYDVAGGLEQNKAVGDALTPGLGTVLGAAGGTVGAGMKYMSDKRLANVPEEARKAVGKIVQGKTDDIEPALRVLNQIDSNGVKTYKDLSSKIGNNIDALRTAQSELLGQDTTLRKLSELKKVSTVGGKKVESNFVEQALKNLDELYSTSSDPENAQRIKNVLEKANTQGLTVKELNDVAMEYGREFGSKAFSKTGEPRTSVNAVSFENIRKGVKETFRGLLPDEKSKMIDKNMSEHIDTQKLVDKMTEKVNNLSQKVNERGLLEKVGRFTGNTVDAVTGGFLKGTVQSLFPSNAGNKTLNSLDLEKALSGKLKDLDKLDGLLSNKKFTDKVKKIGGKVTMVTLLNAAREFTD